MQPLLTELYSELDLQAGTVLHWIEPRAGYMPPPNFY